METEFRVSREPFSQKEIEIRARSGNSYLQEVEFKPPADEGAYIPAPLRLTSGEAQQLIDELWRCGLRPTEGTGSAGSLKATENHLADMREIAFKTLKIKSLG